MTFKCYWTPIVLEPVSLCKKVHSQQQQTDCTLNGSLKKNVKSEWNFKRKKIFEELEKQLNLALSLQYLELQMYY